jgi:hypothetical protein|tara:strand:- start:589 stop:870 length:282 start_codon:yes stop_codon:yes gene_type:complete
MNIAWLNFYDVFVNNVFGGLGFAFMGLSVLFFLIGMTSKMSPPLIIYLFVLWTMCYGILMFGGVAAMIFMFLALTYASYAVYTFFIRSALWGT